MNQPEGSSVQVGDIIAGKYQVERVLGEGGMGVVVAARHVDLHELRAIKFMLPAARAHPETVERFMREARATVRLKNEHVVTIYDVGRFNTGEPYMVMEYLEGSDLEGLSKSGPLPVEQAVEYILQALEALAEAHVEGIIHRDLKPANLFLTTSSDGLPCVKVLDFGISKLTGAIAAASGMDMTKTKALLGSPWYMSPEHMRSARNVDARTDIWSMGVILYKLLTGVVPFGGETVGEVFARVLQDQPERPSTFRPDIPAELEAVMLRSLTKDPAHRYQDVGQFAAELVPFGPERGPISVDRISRILGTTGQQPVVQITEPGLGPQQPVSPTPFGQSSTTPTTPLGKTPPAGIVPTTPLGQTPPVGIVPNAPLNSTTARSSWGSTDPGVVPHKSSRLGIVIGVTASLTVALIAVLVVALGGSPDEPSAAAGAEPTSSSAPVALTSRSSDPDTLPSHTSTAANSTATASAASADAGAAAKKVAHKTKRPKTPANTGGKTGPKKPPSTPPTAANKPVSKPKDNPSDWSRY